MYYPIYIQNYILLKKDSFDENAYTKIIEKNKQKDKDNPWIFCTVCRNHLTKKKEAIEIDSKHTHSFLNPHGIFYNIKCFKKASGALPYGQSTEQFTWFKGYSWQIVLCSSCKIHIGWKYDSSNDRFYGLIENRLSY